MRLKINCRRQCVSSHFIVMVYIVVRSKRAKTSTSSVEESINSISDYFQWRHCETPETDDSIFAKLLTSELGKITSDDIKRHVKRKLTDIMFDAVEEDAQRQQQQQQPQEVQYVMVGDTSTLQFLHVSEP